MTPTIKLTGIANNSIKYLYNVCVSFYQTSVAIATLARMS